MTFTYRTKIRREQQLKIFNSGQNIIISSHTDIPINIDYLLKIDENHPIVEEVHSGGLSAIVYKDKKEIAIDIFKEIIKSLKEKEADNAVFRLF